MNRAAHKPHASAAEPSVAERLAALDWSESRSALDTHGCATTGVLIGADECAALAGTYPRDELFRSRVIMARHGFGRGEYKYFAYPLPETIAALRTALYPPLAAIANRWNEAMGIEIRYPDDHRAYLKRCHDAGQTKPTPLLLQYGEGDYNCLHQDLYGEHVFPLQVAILLSEPGRDFTGGEFVLTEQRPRMQSRPEVVPLRQGDGGDLPRSITGPCRARAASTGSTCATASAGCAAATAIRSGSSFTTPSENHSGARSAQAHVKCARPGPPPPARPRAPRRGRHEQSRSPAQDRGIRPRRATAAPAGATPRVRRTDCGSRARPCR